MEEAEDWSDSWRVHEHTRKLKREAVAARDNAMSIMLSRASESEDAGVRSAYEAYRCSQAAVEMLEKGKWP